MMLFEVDQAANRIRAEVDPDANIIFGGTILENMEGRMRVSVVATGIEAEQMRELPENIERLRPRAAAQMQPRVEPQSGRCPHRLQPLPPSRALRSIRCHRQVEALAEELNAPMAADIAEAIVFEDEAMPEPDDDARSGRDECRAAPAHRTGSHADGPAAEEPKPCFGLFGRQAEGRCASGTGTHAGRPAARDIAGHRPHPARTGGASRAGPGEPADDLFPEHKKDEQFEIPAFLRRQTN